MITGVKGDDLCIVWVFQGDIMIATALDREEQAMYSFTVRAVDNRIPQRTAYAAVSIISISKLLISGRGS